MLSSWPLLKGNLKILHQKRDFMWFCKRYPVSWTDWRWSGSFREITRTLRKCRNSFHWLLTKLQTKFRIRFKFQSFSTWTKKHKKSFIMPSSWLFKENKCCNFGMHNSREPKHQWTTSNLSDGNSSQDQSLSDASTWWTFWETFCWSQITWRSFWCFWVRTWNQWQEIQRESTSWQSKWKSWFCHSRRANKTFLTSQHNQSGTSCSTTSSRNRTFWKTGPWSWSTTRSRIWDRARVHLTCWTISSRLRRWTRFQSDCSGSTQTCWTVTTRSWYRTGSCLTRGRKRTKMVTTVQW